jgi:glycosyltransferase involved in cell wall biosynthesis
VSEVSKFASDNDCEIILSSIQGQTMTRLVRPISRKLKLDYVAQTWDPLEWWMKESKFDPISRFLNLKEFGAVAKNSKKFMSMSWAMSIEFEKEYHAHCVTNIPGLQSGMIDRLSSQNDKTFIISFAGQLYAKEEFAALVQALEKMRWRYNDKKIILYLYGKVFDQKYHNNSNIKIKGYVEQGELLTLLASSNLLYCPYWFSKDYEKASRISFPAKLTSFLKTGRPVLMHAPSYASPRIFLEYNSAAYICNSLDVDEMVRTIKRIIDDPNSDKVGKRGYELFEKYMTYSSMKNSLLVSLGLMKEEKIKEFELVRNLYVEKVDV